MLTTVLLLTAPQVGLDSLPYHERGWPSFERLVSMLLTRGCLVLLKISREVLRDRLGLSDDGAAA